MSILSRALSILALATACGGSQAADDPTVSGDADTDTDTDTDVDTDTDTDVDTATEPLQLVGYAFVDRAGVTDSVAYSGQTFRHVLIADLSSYIGRLTDRLDGGLEPTPGEIRSDLDFYLRFDSSVGGPIPHSIETTPSPLQTTYDDISSGKNLLEKLAGNDEVGQHKDWSTSFRGWSDPAVTTPESLIDRWCEELDAAAVDWGSGTYPQTSAGEPVASVFVTSDGRDLQQLISTFLRVAIAYSQSADDYLDDDTEGKGLLSDHSAPEDGKPYTALEHAWDEGFGYTGMTRRYADWTQTQRLDGLADDNGDGRIDLLSEQAFHLARLAPERDDGSATGTDYTGDLYDAFFAGRTLLASLPGPLSPGDLEDLRQHRDDALTAWERLLAAEVIHNLNLTLADLDALGTPDHVFEEQAQHWSQMKGFALGFQFSRHSALNDAQFLELHSLIGQQPVIDATDAAAVRTYRDDLLDARALLAFAFAFDAADVEAW